MGRGWTVRVNTNYILLSTNIKQFFNQGMGNRQIGIHYQVGFKGEVTGSTEGGRHISVHLLVDGYNVKISLVGVVSVQDSTILLLIFKTFTRVEPSKSPTKSNKSYLRSDFACYLNKIQIV